MSILDEVMAANQYFVQHLPLEYTNEDTAVGKLPSRHLAILTCMDTRLVEFLEHALGISRGQAKIIKNAGNTVTGPFEATIRSLVVGVFELDVKEIMVIGHYDCGVANSTSQGLADKMLARGISEAAIRMIREELERWVDEFHDPLENVRHAVDKIRSNPLIPIDVPVHGLIFDPKSGKIETIVDGYEAVR